MASIDNDESLYEYAGASGVDFTEDAEPDHLPGYNESNITKTFLSVIDSADSDPSPIKNGISNTGGEHLGIVFDLLDNKS